MKRELLEEFGVRESAVSVIPYGINHAVSDTDLTVDEAKARLGIGHEERTILFFGAIAPYKGLEYLVDAFQQIATRRGGYRLIIAGLPKKGCERYLDEIQETVRRGVNQGAAIQKTANIPDDEAELYVKAAHDLAPPYCALFQTGRLVLGSD